MTVIIPALNEERAVRGSYEQSASALRDLFEDYEVLLVNDGSTDGTGEVMAAIAEADPKARVLTNPQNLGLGAACRAGYAAARCQYASTAGADAGPGATDVYNRVYSQIGKADLVIGYAINNAERPFVRRVISSFFTRTMNLLFGLRLHYYNGCCVFPVRLVNEAGIGTNSFAFQAEIIVKLLKAGHSYVEVGYFNADREQGRSKAFRMKNVLGVGRTILRLLGEVYLKRRTTSRTAG